MPRIILALILLAVGMARAESTIGPPDTTKQYLQVNANGETDLDVQTRMADAAKWSILISGGAIIVSLFAIGYGIYQSIDSHSKKQQELRARVNISIRPEDIVIGDRGAGTFGVQINPRISNDGETAAEAIVYLPRTPFGRVRDDLSTIETVIENDIEFFRNSGREVPGVLIVTNTPTSLGAREIRTDVHDAEVRLNFRDFAEEPLPQDGVEVIPVILYYSGFIKYRDIFQRVWVRRFVWQFFMNSSRTRVTNVIERRNWESIDKAWPKTT